MLLSPVTYQKLKHWVKLAQGEVSGLGTIIEKKGKNGVVEGFIIDDIYLLKQESSSADTLLDDQAVGQFLVEMAKADKDTSTIKLWWHSHGDLNVFWSSTDEQCIADLANSSYLISLVTNKEGKILTRIDVYRPFQMTLNDVRTDIYQPQDPELAEFCKQEFKAKVLERMTIPLEPDWLMASQSKFDDEYTKLEDLVNSGTMSVDEFNDKVLELEAEIELAGL